MTIKVPKESHLYPSNWSTIAWDTKEKANWRCQHCSHPHSPGTRFCLTVHHKDHNTFNNSDANLIPLCHRCHLIEEGKYRSHLLIQRHLNALQASGQQILPTFETILFPQPNNP